MEEVADGRKCCAADRGWEQEQAVPENIERVKKAELLEVGAECQHVLSCKVADIIGELPDILVKDVID